MPRESRTSDPPLPQPGRLWTVDQANARLDGIRETLPSLRAWVVRLRKLHDELHRLAAFWGKEVDAADHPDRQSKLRLEEEWQSLSRRLEKAVATLQEEGIEVKDLDSGLIDFYSVVNGEVVFLCWKRGEDAVSFYHTLEGGYRNRRPLRPLDARTTPRAGRPG